MTLNYKMYFSPTQVENVMVVAGASYVISTIMTWAAGVHPLWLVGPFVMLLQITVWMFFCYVDGAPLV